MSVHGLVDETHTQKKNEDENREAQKCYIGFGACPLFRAEMGACFSVAAFSLCCDGSETRTGPGSWISPVSARDRPSVRRR